MMLPRGKAEGGFRCHLAGHGCFDFNPLPQAEGVDCGGVPQDGVGV